MYPYFLVACGGALGSVLRYGTGLAVGRVWSSGFPLATMLVNIAGSLIMGLFIGWLTRAVPAAQAELRLFFAVGVLGGFTTFSSFTLDTIGMVERGEAASALLYVGASVIVGLVALFAGLSVMRGVSA